MTAPHDRDLPPAAGEDAAIRLIADLISACVRRDYPPGTLARRDAHPKHHGCVRAEFRVSDDVPADLRFGLFAKPHTYPAWIRFSNGSPRVQADARRDQRGMAIKLLDVPGQKILDDERDAQTQDFVLASFPRFFIANVEHYVDFSRAAARKPAFRLFEYYFARLPWRLHEFRTLMASLQPAANVLALRYWSQTPYRLGPHAVKYSARDTGATVTGTRTAPSSSPDFLREAMAAHLRDRSATFEFLVQRHVEGMSIEDSTIEWDEARAPFRRVAMITIPPQDFQSPAQMTLAEQISYTPWHSLPEHAPLGGVNRVRRVVYERISRLRHELNGVPRREPTSLDLDLSTASVQGSASGKDLL
jgi:hypothetical protein